MDQLTAFERALLSQFESLALSCETSLKQSGDTARALSSLSSGFGERVARVEKGQGDLSVQLEDLSERLTAQTRQVTALIDALNRLLDGQSR